MGRLNKELMRGARLDLKTEVGEFVNDPANVDATGADVAKACKRNHPTVSTGAVCQALLDAGVDAALIDPIEIQNALYSKAKLKALRGE